MSDKYVYRVTFNDGGYWVLARSRTFKGIYRTIGHAKTAIKTANQSYRDRYEYRVERAPLGDWEPIDDEQ